MPYVAYRTTHVLPASSVKPRGFAARSRLFRSRLLDLNTELVGLEVADAAPDLEAREDVGQVQVVVDDRGGLRRRRAGLRVRDEVVQVEAPLVDGAGRHVADDRPAFELLRHVGAERLAVDGGLAARVLLALALGEDVGGLVEPDHEERAATGAAVARGR